MEGVAWWWKIAYILIMSSVRRPFRPLLKTIINALLDRIVIITILRMPSSFSSELEAVVYF